LPVVNEDGTPKWRVAPSPHGSYWQKGMKLGYQDVGSWTLLKSTPTERAPKLGGLIEFYRSPARVQWTPTGTNVPDYPKLAQLWWQNIGDAASGAKTPQEAMDALCAAQESVMARLEKAGVQGDIGPKLNEEHDLAYWNNYAKEHGTLAPQLKLANEKEKPETIDYDELVKSWNE
jgi:glycerol transport system substrate-binding protein